MKNLIQIIRRFFLIFKRPKTYYKIISTKQSWKNLKLNENIKLQLKDLENRTCTKTGCVCIFYGKNPQFETVAALLGEHSGRKVFKIDLSAIVSKYIGETEKNLDRLFDLAEKSNAILFFDEADALFGKRAEIKNEHDKYVIQSNAYLLQKIEDYPKPVIIAVNNKTTLEHTFIGRANIIINFKEAKVEV